MSWLNKKKIHSDIAFLYERLSRDDDLEGESYSIANQKKLLTKVAKEKGYTHIVHFFDDGISGVTMNRPKFNEMIEQLKLGKGGAVFVKDLSRLGRNYIEVGRLIEEFFPENGIRLVAVSDGIDSFEGESEFAPIKNLFNEWYSRDISKKRRLSNKVKGSSGVPLGAPPYGYKRDDKNPNHWVVDEEAARVVKMIDTLTLSGYGTEQIASILSEKMLFTPTAYAVEKGYKKPLKQHTAGPYSWNSTTIIKILSLQEYCGDVINFKTYSISYKNKKRIRNDPEDMMVFENVHEPIRDRATFERIQEMRGKTRRRKMSNGEHNMFSGLLVCSDCGGKLGYHFNQQNPSIKYFNCQNYNKGKQKKCKSTHYVRVDFLEQVVLSEIRRLTRFACKYEDEFTRAVTAYSKEVLESHKKTCCGELNALISRNKEIDRLFERIYEDNVSGKISDERFGKLSEKYESEQISIAERVEQLKKAYDEMSEKAGQADFFISAVKKYTRVKKLTPLMLNELVEKIEVHQTEIVDGKRTQKIVIYYNCIGAISIPDDLPIPNAEITLDTRQGVQVSYTSSKAS